MGSESRGIGATVLPVRGPRLWPSTPHMQRWVLICAERRDSASVLQREQRRERGTPKSPSSGITSPCLDLLMPLSKLDVSPCRPQGVFVSQEFSLPKSSSCCAPHSGCSMGPQAPAPHPLPATPLRPTHHFPVPPHRLGFGLWGLSNWNLVSLPVQPQESNATPNTWLDCPSSWDTFWDSCWGESQLAWG